MKIHKYKATIRWTGNEGQGTVSSDAYNKNHDISVDGKYEVIRGSSDPAFYGDKSRYNPEDLLLSAISACHMLCYLHLCTVHHIVVTAYTDHATGIMEEDANGGGRFTKVTLYPRVIISDQNNIDKANALHEEAHKQCFIANSCNFEINHRPDTRIEAPSG